MEVGSRTSRASTKPLERRPRVVDPLKTNVTKGFSGHPVDPEGTTTPKTGVVVPRPPSLLSLGHFSLPVFPVSSVTFS